MLLILSYEKLKAGKIDKSKNITYLQIHLNHGQ